MVHEHSDRTRQILDAHLWNSPLAVVEFDTDFTVIRWSAEAERVFGYTASEAMGRAIADIDWIYEDDAELVAQESARLFAGESARSVHVNRNRRKDGSVIWCEWYSSAIYDDSGTLTSVLSLVLDITERRRAVELAENELARTSLLLDASAKFSRLNEPDAILEAVAQLCLQATGIGRAFVNTVDIPNAEIVLGVATGGVIPPVPGTVVPFDALSALSHEAILGGRTTLLDFEQSGLAPADLAIATSNECRLALFVPLVHKGEMIAHITMDERGSRHDFTAEEISIVEAIASQAAISLANARLLACEHEASEMNRMLAEASRLLASTIELDKGLPEALAMVGSALDASGIAILLHADTEWLMRYGWAVSESLTGHRFTAAQDDGHEHARVSREPFLVTDASQSGDWSARFARRMGFAAFAIKPMVVRGKFIGTIDFGFKAPRRFDDAMRDTLSRIAYAFASAIDNARLYEVEHNIAETLQDMLVVLPARLDGVRFASSYESATFEAGRVGGDFIDLFEVDARTVGVVIGDVSGKGLEAAVITSLIRNTIRAHALDGMDPVAVCTKTNTVICRFTGPEEFVTLFFGLLDTDTGEVRYVSAGHPPAVILSADGSAEELCVSSPVVGAFEKPVFEQASVTLGRGERLVLFSDGVTEARSPDAGGFLGQEGLSRVLASRADVPTEELAETLMSDVLAYSQGVLRDDAALLVVEVSGAG